MREAKQVARVITPRSGRFTPPALSPMGRCSQLLCRKPFQMLVELSGTPLPQHGADRALFEPEAGLNVLQGSLAWPIPVRVDLDGHRTPLSVLRRNLNPEELAVSDLPSGSASQAGKGAEELLGVFRRCQYSEISLC